MPVGLEVPSKFGRGTDLSVRLSIDPCPPQYRHEVQISNDNGSSSCWACSTGVKLWISYKRGESETLVAVTVIEHQYQQSPPLQS
jgi:hypothetical protein